MTEYVATRNNGWGGAEVVKSLNKRQCFHQVPLELLNKVFNDLIFFLDIKTSNIFGLIISYFHAKQGSEKTIK